jgi:hypothetical protein
MLFPLLRGHVELERPGADIRARLVLSPAFEVEVDRDVLVLSRKRMVPNRGIFRLLVPRVRATVSLAEGRARYVIRPDGLALFMMLVLIGGVVVELTMSREKYPREYPPAFVYGLAAGYFALIGLEVAMTDRFVRRALIGAAH